MRKSYRLYNHEYSNARVDIYFDGNNSARKITLWSYATCVCGAYRISDGGWTAFCRGTFSNATRRQISWFSRQPLQSNRYWKLSYYFFKEINEKNYWGIRDLTDEEVLCFQDLIWQYTQNGKKLNVYC